MKAYEQYLQDKLQERAEAGTLRTLFVPDGLVDFCSNDYLGYARDSGLFDSVAAACQLHKENGSSGSRLISGNRSLTEQLETKLAHFYQAPSALIFNSGYDANLGLLSAVAYKNDLIIYDELCHASILDGIKLSKAGSIRFLHNQLSDLEKKLKESTAKKYIIVESVYSMDGDFAPLEDIVKLAKKYEAAVIVDEAHASGIFGPKGEGRVVELNLSNEIFARVHTFGKALGMHGAIVAGSENLKSFLINFGRPFIYSTALPIHSVLGVKTAHDKLSIDSFNRLKIRHLIQFFKNQLKDLSTDCLIPSESPIQALIIPGNDRCLSFSNLLLQHGFYAKAILSPTVPKGKERVRICLHTFNSEEEIKALCSLIKTAMNVS